MENVLQQWNEKERRSDRNDRREFSERRMFRERRYDHRNAGTPVRRSFRAWIRFLVNPRLGVDRRKKEERRLYEDRRSQKLRSILTPEELADLLE
jgi:hypothetical protein